MGPLWKATVVFRLESPAFDNDRDAHDQRLNAIRTWLEDRDAVAFIVTAFSSVAIGNIIGGTLVLAFQEASNFLLSNLLGVFYAVGQYFAETIPNFIALFGIVTTADFWKGMGNALMGIAQGFIALLLDGVAMLLEKLKNIPGVGKKADSAAAGVREQAAKIRAAGQENTPNVGDTLSLTTGTWTGYGTTTSYQWKRGGTAIAGATTAIRTTP